MSNKSLLDLSREAVELDDLLASVENADAPEVQALIAKMLDLSAEKDRKVDAYCGLIRELELRADARAAEAKRLTERARITSNVADGLKERLKLALATMGINKVETDHFTVSRVKNGGKVPMEVDEEAVPLEYTELVQTARTNKERIRAELEAGKTLAFARLGERGESVRIK